jgi:Tfp pilus assembly protein PilZ
MTFGQEIILSFSSPNREEPVKIAGEIVWSVPRGIGVKFKVTSQDLEDVIKSL